MNKASTFINFCSTIFLLLFPSFLLVILISSTIYFCVEAKVSESPLSGDYNIKWLKIVLKVLDRFFCHNKYQTT